jgi:hypothetical protein
LSLDVRTVILPFGIFLIHRDIRFSVTKYPDLDEKVSPQRKSDCMSACSTDEFYVVIRVIRGWTPEGSLVLAVLGYGFA